MNISNITVLKNFMPESDFKKIFKDVEKNFNKNIHKDNLKSGKQTTPNLHLIHKKPHWKKFFNKLKNTINNKKMYKCWATKIDKKENNFYHSHSNVLTCVFYLQNKDYYLGTHLKQNDQEIIIPGYENSILIFNGNIIHDSVFPNYKLKKPRYTLVTDFNI